MRPGSQKREDKSTVKNDASRALPRTRIHRVLVRATSLTTSDVGAATSLCEQAIREAKSSGMKDLLAASLGVAANAYLIQGDRKKATSYFTQARAIYERLGEADALLEMEHGIVTARLSTGNEKDNIVRLHEILREWIALSGQSKDESESNLAPSSFILHPSSFPAVRSWEDRVLARTPSPTQSEANHRIQLGAIYDSLGTAYLVIREHHKAAAFLEEELAIYRSLSGADARVPARTPELHRKDKSRARLISERISNALNNLGYVHTLLGNGVVALEYCQQGLKLARQLGDKRAIAINQRNLGELYLHSGQVQLGKRLAMKSFQTSSELGLWESACRALVTLTRYERLHGSVARAASLTAKALKVLKGRDKGSQYYYFSLQHLLIEYAQTGDEQVYPKLLDLYKITKDKGLELQHQVAQELARISEELHLLPDAVRWSKNVHEYEIERLNSEQRNAILSLKTEQEVERLAREQEVSDLRMKNLEMELSTKARETELLAVQLAKKGSFLATLTDQIALMKDAGKYAPATIDAVVQLIESIRHKDTEFEQLEARAKSLHQDFILALTEQFPNLTTAERRIKVRPPA